MQREFDPESSAKVVFPQDSAPQELAGQVADADPGRVQRAADDWVELGSQPPGEVFTDVSDDETDARQTTQEVRARTAAIVPKIELEESPASSDTVRRGYEAAYNRLTSDGLPEDLARTVLAELAEARPSRLPHVLRLFPEVGNNPTVILAHGEGTQENSTKAAPKDLGDTQDTPVSPSETSSTSGELVLRGSTAIEAEIVEGEIVDDEPEAPTKTSTLEPVQGSHLPEKTYTKPNPEFPLIKYDEASQSFVPVETAVETENQARTIEYPHSAVTITAPEEVALNYITTVDYAEKDPDTPQLRAVFCRHEPENAKAIADALSDCDVIVFEGGVLGRYDSPDADEALSNVPQDTYQQNLNFAMWERSEGYKDAVIAHLRGSGEKHVETIGAGTGGIVTKVNEEWHAARAASTRSCVDTKSFDQFAVSRKAMRHFVAMGANDLNVRDPIMAAHLKNIIKETKAHRPQAKIGVVVHPGHYRVLTENMPYAPGIKGEVEKVLDPTWQWHWRAEREAQNGNAEQANLHADRAVLAKHFYRFNLAQARMHHPAIYDKEGKEHKENDNLLREAIVGALTDDEVKKVCEKLETGSRFSNNPLAFRKRLQEAFDFTIKRYVKQQTQTKK